MFRNRYASNNQRSYVRQWYNTFNIISQVPSVTNERTFITDEDVMATTRNDGSTEMENYDDEDEEMTTTIDIENEEISEDELENEEVIIDQPDEEVIVDQPLSSEQLSYSSGELINENITITYGNSSPATQAYDELVDIIYNPQFRKEDVVPNSRRFRKDR
ncbi:hypothetical protein GLOIN_2v1775383 [Rhizophagus irregularis DAOM 181602=DAOM 197198]|uniref:Uncharacterized protein n=1 Tax=Rhizophagus irregularis (strain DAOM 181602 / DAOM 197198 / MUCL 43194) TaxID=747089 RepID=A0A2P4PZZ7_RHIID|nr:hypothetical protein GLOIN_2v1775383 [Rhizophagus irregularis DAOM 181602=DAOM 197198]POG70963.1 hypothetical protein GLOIN_2v1775383 [Rhizophagus irregularis DAOM 181602=DAOM 197198]GET58765.1 hypothetical protein GLOIN_2v1775383 [Rhizophagus irregularis DAOM 181602=DAOM 197198]|eukprot:XP_025177829.1 hypothetical protein GLOIN_2v1775383 [Rhizophagus irregularis DAOM 181602=DAOM 197198]